jgi:hypothetical protein
MRRSRVLISLLTDQDTTNVGFGRNFTELLFAVRDLTPERVGNFEPISNEVRGEDDVLAFWPHDPVLWVRKHSIASEGSVHHTGPYGSGAVIIRAIYDPSFDWLTFFERLVATATPHYGYLHLLAESEIVRTRLSKASLRDFFLGAFSRVVADGFIDLAWANYFGPRWQGFIDIEAIRKESAVIKIVQPERGILFAITNHLSDVQEDFAQFDARRTSLKIAFAPNMFRSNSSTSYGTRAIPVAPS